MENIQLEDGWSLQQNDKRRREWALHKDGVLVVWCNPTYGFKFETHTQVSDRLLALLLRKVAEEDLKRKANARRRKKLDVRLREHILSAEHCEDARDYVLAAIELANELKLEPE